MNSLEEEGSWRIVLWNVLGGGGIGPSLLEWAENN